MGRVLVLGRSGKMALAHHRSVGTGLAHCPAGTDQGLQWVGTGQVQAPRLAEDTDQFEARRVLHAGDTEPAAQTATTDWAVAMQSWARPDLGTFGAVVADMVRGGEA